MEGTRTNIPITGAWCSWQPEVVVVLRDAEKLSIIGAKVEVHTCAIGPRDKQSRSKRKAVGGFIGIRRTNDDEGCPPIDIDPLIEHGKVREHA